MWKCCWCMLLAALLVGQAAGAAEDVPWWKQQKIRFMWGKWIYFRLAENAEGHSCDLPREVLRNIAQAGGTVYAELQGYRPGNARLVHECGMKYFVTTFLDVMGMPGGRQWVMENGKQHRYFSVVENRRVAGGKVAQRKRVARRDGAYLLRKPATSEPRTAWRFPATSRSCTISPRL